MKSGKVRKLNRRFKKTADKLKDCLLSGVFTKEYSSFDSKNFKRQLKRYRVEGKTKKALKSFSRALLGE